ncbi:MAG: Gfo/Idh/MocA family oxidoreductase [Sedimentisphaerales bacterium]|nr:Gfo/Idh/MocA family oxidoreductase [Sedimentisphaerales bacterium]
MKKSFNRRDFVKGAAAISVGSVLIPSSNIFAQGTGKLKVALVGCGGRGRGALEDIHNAARHLNIQIEIAGLCDFFMDRAKDTAKQFDVSEALCMAGANSYKDIMKTDADIVLLVTPPIFRPVHLEAAIKAGKHVFMEKPAAVDAPGARKIIEAGELAKQKGLSIVAGTQRRHQESYLKTQQAVSKGAIGPIRGGSVWWCQSHLWYAKRKPGEDDASYMVRNWVSFAEMSGDHIVEQHLHNIDVANWFIGGPPKMAIGFGGRARRRTGNQFDFFSVDFDYGNDVKIHSMCRQIDRCYDRVAELFTGTIGSTYGDGPGKDGFAKKVQVDDIRCVDNPYVQEHIDLINSILNDKPINEAENVATSTLTAIMGRISAYTGSPVRWKDVTDEPSDSPWYSMTMSPSPIDFEKGTVKAPKEDVAAIPGKDPDEA